MGKLLENINKEYVLRINKTEVKGKVIYFPLKQESIEILIQKSHAIQSDIHDFALEAIAKTFSYIVRGFLDEEVIIEKLQQHSYPSDAERFLIFIPDGDDERIFEYSKKFNLDEKAFMRFLLEYSIH